MKKRFSTFFIVSILILLLKPALPQDRKLIAGAYSRIYYDNRSQQTILINGGNDRGPWHTRSIELWRWNGKTWEKLSDNGPQRILAAIAFDPDKKRLYVYGGNGGENFIYVYSDLWEWDGKKWKQVYKGDTYKFDMQKNMFIRVYE